MLYIKSVSGKAGNIKGQIQPGGNPFEAPRDKEYALPPLTPILASEMFSNAARNAGYHPFLAIFDRCDVRRRAHRRRYKRSTRSQSRVS